MISSLDKKGDAPRPLPLPVETLNVPEIIESDTLFVWDFLYTYP
jgi:hypothetical protein